MLPFAETVLAWRLWRGMTQAELAHGSGISRPNLSAIERGNREVTLKTLRALAAALDVRPGVLVDGCTPNTGAPALTRASLERIAAATANKNTLSVPREAALARHLRATVSARLTMSSDSKAANDSQQGKTKRAETRANDKRRKHQHGKHQHEKHDRLVRRSDLERGGAAGDRGYFFLRATETPEVVASLIERATGYLARR